MSLKEELLLDLDGLLAPEIAKLKKRITSLEQDMQSINEYLITIHAAHAPPNLTYRTGVHPDTAVVQFNHPCPQCLITPAFNHYCSYSDCPCGFNKDNI